MFSDLHFIFSEIWDDIFTVKLTNPHRFHSVSENFIEK